MEKNMIFWGAQSNKRKPHYAELIVKLTKNCFISGFKCTRLYRQAKSICSHFWFLLVPGKPKLEEWGGEGKQKSTNWHPIEYISHVYDKAT